MASCEPIDCQPHFDCALCGVTSNLGGREAEHDPSSSHELSISTLIARYLLIGSIVEFEAIDLDGNTDNVPSFVTKTNGEINAIFEFIRGDPHLLIEDSSLRETQRIVVIKLTYEL